MDPEFQYAALLRVHLCEPAQTGHSLQESDAGPAESLVRAARHRVYVLLCAAGRCHGHGRVHAYPEGEDHGEGDQPYGQSGLCGPGLLDIRDALRRAMGQRGLGNLLGLGSQRNLGCRHVALLSGVHAPAQGQAR